VVSDLLKPEANGLKGIQNMKSNARVSRSALRRLLPVLYGILMSAYSANGAELPLKDIKLPPGFEISIYAGNLPNARSLAFLQRIYPAGAKAWPPRGCAGYALLHGLNVSRRVSQPDFYCGTRLLEPEHAHRISNHGCAIREEQSSFL
jgi:hypothetical protein